MQHSRKSVRRLVQSLDGAPSFRKLRLLDAPTPGVSKRPWMFRDAVPDFLSLLGERHGMWIDSLSKASVHRWAERWSDRVLGSIQAGEVHQYFEYLAGEGFSRSEIEKERALLRAFYRWARHSGRAEAEPAVALLRERATPAEGSAVWNPTEQRNLLAAAWGKLAANSAPSPIGARKPLAVPRYMYPIVFVALRTGLRLSDILRLEWRHVRLSDDRIHIPAGEVRTGHEIDAPFDRDVRRLFGGLVRMARSMARPPRRVFEAAGLPTWKGEPDEREVLRAFEAVRRRAGVRPGDFGSLRLSFLKNCAAAAVPLEDALRLCDWEGDPDRVRGLFESRPAACAG